MPKNMRKFEKMLLKWCQNEVKNRWQTIENSQNGARSEPKGAIRSPKGNQRAPKGSQKWANRRPKCIKRSTFGKGREKGGRAWGIPAPLFRRFLFKKALKNQCKNRCRKSKGIYEKVLPKWCQNEVQNQWQIYEFSEPVISCFLRRV